MQKLNTCPACINEQLGNKTTAAPHICTVSKGERKAFITHNTMPISALQKGTILPKKQLQLLN